MRDTKIFKETTEKLYREIKKKADKIGGTSHPSNLDIDLPKGIFNDDEWKFLVENESKFNYNVIIGAMTN